MNMIFKPPTARLTGGGLTLSQRLQQWRIGTRLAFSHALLIVLLLCIGGQGAYVARQLASDLGHTADEGLVKLRLANEVSQHVQTIAAATRDLLLLDEARQIKKQQALIAQSRQDIDAAWKAMDAHMAAEAERATLQQAQAGHAGFIKALDKFLQACAEGNPDDARASLVMDLRPAQKAYQEQIRTLAQGQFDAAKQRARDGEASAQVATWVTLALVLCGTALGLGAAWLITRSILQPVNEARDTARAISAGNLGHRCNVQGRDEMSDMLQALAQMQDTLSTVVTDVSSAAQAVAGNSQRIEHSNAQLSDRTARSSAHLQQTASSIEQITSTLKGTSDLSVSAARIATETRTAADAGGAAVQSVIDSMQHIAASSLKIREIINVIDSISFQTNILALNAAVEAARAGEHGKGFAVVASEVRALASRSANAAREVRELILRSTEQVELGGQCVGEAGERIQDVVRRVSEMSGLIEEISNAAHEQAAGVSVVNSAMCELDRSTQQNTTLVDELAGSARNLSSGAQQLLSSVGFFKNQRVAA